MCHAMAIWGLGSWVGSSFVAFADGEVNDPKGTLANKSNGMWLPEMCE